MRFIAVARRAGTDGEPAVDLVDARPVSDSSQWKPVLTQLVREHKLSRHTCVAVLDSSAYQLTQIEAPDVPASELRAAVRWRLKEFVTYRIEDAVVDAFGLPSAPGRSGSRLMLAVAAPARGVKLVVEALEGAGLVPEAIDIPELVLRNLAAQVPDQAGGVAVVALSDTGGVVTVSQGDVLYLARSIEFGGEQLRVNATGYGDNLVLELQRSLDYYESQLASRPASRVLLAPFGGDRDALLERMNSQMGIASFGLDLGQIVDCKTEIPLNLQAQALYAVGGALRPGQEAA
jgi:MSHA biogenesis protein MshI